MAEDRKRPAFPLPTGPMSGIISYRISVLHSLLGRLTTGIYTSRGLKSHQWKVLSVLYSWPPLPAARITELVTLDKAAISRAIQSLSKLGLAERHFDSRTQTVNVVLTEVGRTMYRSMEAEMARLQKRILAAVPQQKQGTFFGVLNEIEWALREMELTAERGVLGRRRAAGRKTQSLRMDKRKRALKAVDSKPSATGSATSNASALRRY